MENPSKKIYSILEKITKELGTEVDFKIESPKDRSHGDYSSNIALVLAQSSGKNPFEISQDLVKKIGKLAEFEKIEAVKPGFINFYLSKEFLSAQVQNIILEGIGYGSSTFGKGKSASVEFVSANPTGPLHVGNARGGPLGDTIANVLAKAGFKITREYLHNDVGGQVLQLGETIYYQINPEDKPKEYEVSYQGEYIKELAESVKEELSQHDDLSREEFSEKAGKIAVKIMLTEILEDCKKMGISFDKVTKESDLREKISKVLPKLQKLLKEKDGALWFAPNDQFLKDRETVVKKSNGQYTYFASDIVYHDEKMSQYDIVIDILGANHSGHEPRVKAAVKALGHNPDNLKVILYQNVRLKKGSEIIKMSKRAGNFVTAREVLDEVGKDAFRFFLLMQNASTHMDFDLSLAKKKAADNPVFYVQYAYTRISSIFSKAKPSQAQNLNLLKEKEEIELIRKLVEFPYLVEEVSKNLNVNLLTNFAVDLASLFHKFYEKHQVIGKDSDLSLARLALLKATQITLKNTLDLLGVSTPEKM